MAKKHKAVANTPDNKSLAIILSSIIILLAFFCVKLLPGSSKFPERVRCHLMGYKWLNFYPGPEGCFREYSDAGKTCFSGNECVSGTCTVSGLSLGKEVLPNENLTGHCPKFGSAFGEYMVMCGSAKIESGSVVEDMRGCLY